METNTYHTSINLFKLLANPKIKTYHTKTVSYRKLWELRILDGLSKLGFLGSKYDYVYKFIVANIKLPEDKLFLTDAQISDEINKYFVHNNINKSISIHTVSDAINKLKIIKSSANHKSLIARKRYGKYGKYSYLTFNRADVPDKEDLKQFITVEYFVSPNYMKIKSLKLALNKLNKESSIINTYKNIVRKKLQKRIHNLN